MKHNVFIGTSGCTYNDWKGVFYPENLKQIDWLPYYQQFFPTVEINSTFYAMPKRQTFINWYTKAPENFLYVLKASRFITHLKRLHDPEESLEKFFENAFLLKEKLGAILFQLPPGLKYDFLLLENFLKLLPGDKRFAFEFRHSSWYNESTYELLDKYNCAFCIYELGGHLSPQIITGSLVYLRLHGPGSRYRGSYTDETLNQWAERCRHWLKKRNVFVFFDNDEKGYAVNNALRLQDNLLNALK